MQQMAEKEERLRTAAAAAAAAEAARGLERSREELFKRRLDEERGQRAEAEARLSVGFALVSGQWHLTDVPAQCLGGRRALKC